MQNNKEVPPKEHPDLNRKVNWGVLGTVNIARKHTIPGMQEAENCHLHAVAGRSMEKAEAFRDAFGFEKACGSYEALLADPAVEAVYTRCPTNCIRLGEAPWVSAAFSLANSRLMDTILRRIGY